MNPTVKELFSFQGQYSGLRLFLTGIATTAVYLLITLISFLPAMISPENEGCLLYTSPSPRDRTRYRMPSSA